MKRKEFLKNTFLMSGAFAVPSILKAGDWRLHEVDHSIINVNQAGKKFAHFWSKCVGAGRANEGLRAAWLEQLKIAKQYCGFEYCRFHGLFHDDMFVYKEVNNKPVYNWQYIDELFDRMLDIGVKPFVELGFMPAALSSDDSLLQFWWKTHVSPPKDYSKWGALVSEFTKHCVSRYGIKEVSTWYFEVWNEPNLHGFWLGTKSQYFELYKTSALAVKSVDKSLRVGGPATSNFVPDERFDGEIEDKSKHKTLSVPDLNTLDWRGVWIADFLKYCAKEQLPVDFVSCHPYPTDWALDPMTGKGGDGVRKASATRDDMLWLNRTIKSSSFPNAEIHLTEWSSSPSSRDGTHDSLPAAAFIIKSNLECIGLTNSLSYWTFTDVFEEKGAGDTIWHGGFGMINYQGIVKPSFHAYRMLHQLGDEILQQDDGMIITRNSASKKISALLYHYPSEIKNVVKGGTESLLDKGLPKKFSVKLNSMRASSQLVIETLDKHSGYAYAKWKEIGSPEPPTREQIKILQQSGMTVKKEITKADGRGAFEWSRTVEPWTCVLIKEI